MILNSYAGSPGSAEFSLRLLEDFQARADELPLHDYCQHGGSPSEDSSVEVSDLKIAHCDHSIVTGSFHVSFIESYYSGCRDIDFTDKRSGRFEFKLDVCSGDVEFTNPTVRRDYEKDEF